MLEVQSAIHFSNLEKRSSMFYATGPLKPLSLGQDSLSLCLVSSCLEYIFFFFLLSIQYIWYFWWIRFWWIWCHQHSGPISCYLKCSDSSGPFWLYCDGRINIVLGAGPWQYMSSRQTMLHMPHLACDLFLCSPWAKNFLENILNVWKSQNSIFWYVKILWNLSVRK